MSTPKFLLGFALWVAWVGLLPVCATPAGHGNEPNTLPILESWHGDFAVSQLNRLPEGQRASRVGYLGDVVEFSNVWQVFKPGKKMPDVDFRRHLVVFFRNVAFYNRTAILKVILQNGVAEILARETMTALPIEDKAAMALAVIPRTGVKCIRTGNERIPVTGDDFAWASHPLNTTYTIEGREIRLQNGRFEAAAAPGSATKIRTVVFGKPVYGDLDGDGDEDAALFLVHDPGGSGTFYYVAAALNVNGQYIGTNVELLGDRIAPQGVAIRNGVVSASYADRRSGESMSTAPSIGKSMYLTLENGNLIALKSLCHIVVTTDFGSEVTPGYMDASAGDFNQRFDSLAADLKDLDDWLAAVVTEGASRPLVFSHLVYQYFIRRYGLNGQAVHWEPEESPTPEQ